MEHRSGNFESMAAMCANERTLLPCCDKTPKPVCCSAESVMSFDTLQFDDYAKYEAGIFDAEAKARRHEEVFPADCERAFAMGERLVR